MSLADYLRYPFVQYAFVVGTLIALCSSFLGVVLVMKRYSFIGDGLSHVAFGAMAVATIFKMTTNLFIILPLTIAAAILLLRSQSVLVKADAKLAMISVSSLALGYLIMNVFPASGNISGDVCTTLFGSTSILTLRKEEVIISIILSAGLLLFYLLYYNKIFAITFDEAFGRAVGAPVDRYNTVISVVIAIVIVLGMNLVGSLLISALVIFPALSALQLFNDFKKVIAYAMLISVITALAGLTASILLSTPIGATIVLSDLTAFIFSFIIGKLFN